MQEVYLSSDIQAAYLWGQIEKVKDINNNRLEAWSYYYNQLKDLETNGRLQLPTVPERCNHNAHMFYVKVKNLEERNRLLDYLKAEDIIAVFHYVPLHSSVAGEEYGRFFGHDIYTTEESERLVRLPLWYGIAKSEQDKTINSIYKFYK